MRNDDTTHLSRTLSDEQLLAEVTRLAGRERQATAELIGSPIELTVSGETRQKLRRAQDLLHHAIPNGDPAAIFDGALRVLVEN